MFSLKEFIKSGLLKAVGWFEKGVLDEADLAEIQTAIEAQYTEATEETEA